MFRARRSFTMRRLILRTFAFSALLWLAMTLRYSWYCRRESARGMRLISEHWTHLQTSSPDLVLPVLMPVCSRPEYLKEVLGALVRVRNINNTVLIVSQDCGVPEIARLIAQTGVQIRTVHLEHIRPYFGLPSMIFGNEYATAANIFFLLQFAFEHLQAQGAIVLEGDLVPSIDFYDFHVWAHHHFLSAHSVLSGDVLNVNSFNFDSRRDSDAYTLFPGEFTVWGWSTSRVNWFRYLKPYWTAFHNWDWHVQLSIRIPQGLVSATPRLSRVNNIGKKGINFNMDDAQWKHSFGQIYMETKTPVEYENKPVNLYRWDANGFCALAGICTNHTAS